MQHHLLNISCNLDAQAQHDAVPVAVYRSFPKAFRGYPVSRKAMDEPIQMLKQAIKKAKVRDKEKMRSLQRLRAFVPEDIAH
jgi:hypothetical protein